MKTKALNFIDRFKYELGIFVLLLIQALLNFKHIIGMDQRFLPYYLPDFSMAKTSRLLIGQLVNFLTDHPDEAWINNFARVVLFATLVIVAVVLGRVVRNTEKDKCIPLYVVILFFCSGSFTMHIFSQFFGMHDIYMFMAAVLSIVCLQNKYLRWLVPILCAGGVLVNYVFAISYFPVIVLAILYLAEAKEKKAGYIILFCITVIFTAGLTYYCIFLFEDTIAYTFEEIKQIMERKFGAPLYDEQVDLLRGYLFGKTAEGEDYLGGNIHDMGLVETVVNLSKYLFSERLSPNSLVTLGIGSVPVMAVFWGVWINCMRVTKKHGKRFVYLCFILSSLFVIPCILLSTDPIRWFAAGVMTQFAMGFYMFCMHDEAFGKTVESLKAFFADKKFVLLAIYLAYAFIRHLQLN